MEHWIWCLNQIQLQQKRIWYPRANSRRNHRTNFKAALKCGYSFQFLDYLEYDILNIEDWRYCTVCSLLLVGPGRSETQTQISWPKWKIECVESVVWFGGEPTHDGRKISLCCLGFHNEKYFHISWTMFVH